MSKKLEDLLSEVKIEKITVNTPILMRDHRMPKSGKFLREKYEDKFEVNITDNVSVFPNRPNRNAGEVSDTQSQG